MRGLIKMLVAMGLLTFTAYTFYVEPNASEDPIGAASRASQRLATLCDRNREECNFLSDFGEGIGQATSVGWKLITGQGRLVYVSDDGRSYALGSRGFDDSRYAGNHEQGSYDRQSATPSSGNSLGDLIRSTTLFGGGSSNGHNDGEGRYSRYCN